MKKFLSRSVAVLAAFTALGSGSHETWAQTNPSISITVESGARQTFQGFGASINPVGPANYQVLSASERATLNNLLWRDAKMRMARLWFSPALFAPKLGERDYNVYKNAYITSNRIPDARATGSNMIFLIAPDHIPKYMQDTVGPPDSTTIKYIRNDMIVPYANLLADFVVHMKSLGVPVNATGIANEPHGAPTMFRYEQWPGIVKELRAALDARNLQSVQIIAPELANNDNVAKTHIDVLKGKDTGDAQAWNALGGFATHSYNMATVPEVSDMVGPDKPFWQTEAGAIMNYEEDAGDTVEAGSLSARFLNDMNNRVTHWFAFIGVDIADPSDNAMRLVKYTHTPFEYTPLQKYYYLKQLSYAFDVGSVFRYSVSDVDGVMKFTWSNKKRVYAAAAKNPDGKWAIGLSNFTSNYFTDPNASTKYTQQGGIAAQTYDVTVTVKELAASGTRTFDVFKSVPNGDFVAAGQVVFNNGVGTIRGLGSLELVTLREAGSASGVTFNPNKHYRIKNRQTDAYLYDAGADAKYANSPAASNTLYQWKLTQITTGFITIKNRSTGEVLCIENQTGNVQCIKEGFGWQSSRWLPKPTDPVYMRFENRWKPGNYFHTAGQTGTAQYGASLTPPNTLDQWILEEVGPDGEPPQPPDGGQYYLIKNRQTGSYIYHGGIPTWRALHGNNSPLSDTRYHWKVVPNSEGYVKIVSRINSHVLHNQKDPSVVQSSSENAWYWPDWHSSQWKQIATDSGYHRYENRWKAGNYIGIRDQTGLVKYGALGDPAYHYDEWILEPIDSGDPTNLTAN